MEQYLQMFLQQNPQLMGMNPGSMNPGMMGMNPGMMGMNPGMMGINPGMAGINPGMMGMNPSMFGANNNVDINSVRNMLAMNGFNEVMINNFINANFPNQQNQEIQPQQNINYAGLKTLLFKHKTTQKSVIIHASDNETLGSVINKYINKSGDNHVNLYINNGKKLNESLTVAEAGLLSYTTIEVVAIDELEGALII